MVELVQCISILNYSWKVNTKNVVYWKIICIFSNILQKISSQKSFIWEIENDHKKDYNPWIICHHWVIWLLTHSKPRLWDAMENFHPKTQGFVNLWTCSWVWTNGVNMLEVNYQYNIPGLEGWLLQCVLQIMLCFGQMQKSRMPKCNPKFMELQVICIKNKTNFFLNSWVANQVNMLEMNF